MNRNTTITCFAALGVGVVCIGATSCYFFCKVHDLVHRELSNINRIVADIKKDLAELKAASKRRAIGAGSSFSDETSDVYYDFSDEAAESSDLEDLDRDSEDISVSEESTNEIDNEVKKEISTTLSEHLPNNVSSTGVESVVVSNACISVSKSSRTKSKRNKLVRKYLEAIDEMLEILAEKPVSFSIYHNKILDYHDKLYSSHEYLWRLTKACHLCGTIAGENGSLEKKKYFMQQALKYAKNALALTDDDANVHKWYAIAIGSCTEYETIQNKIKFGFEFKEHAQLALQINPNDESVYYLMGRWCYEVAMMPWIERKIATTIYGEVPSATMQDAKNYFISAEKLHQNKGVWKELLLYLAKTSIADSQYAEAMVWLDKAAEDTKGTPEDPVIINEIENLRSKYESYRT